MLGILWNATRIAAVSISFTGLFIGCVPPVEETSEVVIDYGQDPRQSYIEEQVYKQNKDSLYYFLSHPNATYRYLATKGLSSYTPNDVLDTLISKLNDPVPEVVAAIAHALGQLGNPAAEGALTRAFVKRDSVGLWLRANQNILEAIGKIGSQRAHDQLASVTTYLPQDTLLVKGQARALFHFSNRQIHGEQGLMRCIELLDPQKYHESVRLYAAHYIANAPEELLSAKTDTLFFLLQAEQDIDIQIPLIRAGAKTATLEFYQFLVRRFDQWEDDRSRVATLQNMHFFKQFSNSAYPFVLKKLQHKRYHVARSAAEYFYNYGSPKYARMYWVSAKTPKIHPEVSLDMYRASFKHMPLWHVVRMASMRYELFLRFQDSNDPYIRKKVLLAMGENLDNLPFLLDSMVVRSIEDPITQTALASAMTNMVDNLKKQQFGKKRRERYIDSIQTGFARLLNSDLETGALAVLSRGMKSNEFKSEAWIQLLEQQAKKLQLPRQYEAWLEIDKTLAYLKDESYSPPQKKLKRASLPFKFYDGETRALLRTTGGTFILELLPDKAPFTVQNFKQLVAKDYFSGKSFHRVVSNFVIQTGCDLGDSYGALDYTITSELDDAYYESSGMVGMANAGKHTESAQWFITTTPTPRLNGRYTIFARVVSGMQIVRKLQIGDRINSIEIIE